jgi:hypothetical protein
MSIIVSFWRPADLTRDKKAAKDAKMAATRAKARA